MVVFGVGGYVVVVGGGDGAVGTQCLAFTPSSGYLALGNDKVDEAAAEAADLERLIDSGSGIEQHPDAGDDLPRRSRKAGEVQPNA